MADQYVRNFVLMLCDVFCVLYAVFLCWVLCCCDTSAIMLRRSASLYYAALSRLYGGSRRLAVAGLDRRRSLSMLRIVTTIAFVAPAARHSFEAPGARLTLLT